MQALGRRIATAAILVPVFVWCVLATSTASFAMVLGGIAVAGAWEWAGLAGWQAPASRALYAFAFALGLYVVHASAGWSGFPYALVTAGLAWWIVALFWVLRSQAGMEAVGIRSLAIRLAGAWLVLMPAWGALVYMHGTGKSGPYVVLFLLVLIWVADIGAFFVGRRFGRRRLAARVSPGKTWEGVAGAMGAVTVLAVAAGAFAGWGADRLALFVALCLATAGVSILGDLTESLFKRRAGVKDSGALLPGHGGVLDRIDSVSAAAPLFALGGYGLGTMPW